MGFKYKKFEVRTGEVVEPTRVRENMQALAHEINGNLDRENLAEKCIDSEVIAYGTFNALRNTGATTSFSMEGKPIQFVEVMSLTLDVPVDCVVVAHFGAYWTWEEANSTILNGLSSGASAEWSNHIVDEDKYPGIQEHFADFRLRINGEDVCKTFSYPFMRQSQSTYMTGALQAVAGQIKVSVEAKMFRNDKGRTETSEAFYYIIKDRNLIIHAKKR